MPSNRMFRRMEIHPTGRLLFSLLILCLLFPVSASPQNYQDVNGKRYIFKPGSRQAVEVPSGGQSSVGTQQRRTYTSGMRSSNAPRQTSPSTTNSARKTKATTEKDSRAYSFRETFAVGGRVRSCHIYVPAGYRSSVPMPLVLVFHGLGMSAESMTAVTGLNGIAHRNGFIVAYGESVSGRWDDGMRDNKGVDDVEYVNKLLAGLSTKVNIDRHRIYAIGLSNGGYFCQLLAASMPERIAAIAVVGSSVMEGGVSRLKSRLPVPIIIFVGDKDPLVNWGDGRRRDLGKYGDKIGMKDIDPSFYKLARYGGWLSVSDMVSFWVNHNGVSSSPRREALPDRDTTDGMRVKKETYGSRGKEVLLYTIEGGEHSWPGALTLPTSKTRSCQDINAGEEIWKFFKDQSR